MTNAADTQQYAELTQLYATYGETELNTLALTLNDLIAPAQQALQAEYARRNLSLPTPAAQAPPPAPTLLADIPDECIFEFTDREDAILAQSLLQSAGIASTVPTSEIAAVDTPRLIVAPEDATTAQLLLSHPNVGTDEGAFPTANCPQCGTPDPLLESVEPTNQWRCESCNHLWQDPAV